MSGENILDNQAIETQNDTDESKKISRTSKVDINVLLNKVRADQKKEKLENFIFVGLISAVIIVTGIIISL